MVVPFSGGCACGAIRYECSAHPVFSWNCHCRDCQRASGSAFCPVLYVSKATLTITGKSKYYDVRAESGNQVSRGFCPECGSPVFIQAELVPDLQGLWAASLDDPSQFQALGQGVDQKRPALGLPDSDSPEGRESTDREANARVSYSSELKQTTNHSYPTVSRRYWGSQTT